MLALTPIEIIFRVVPEMFLIFWAIYVFSGISLDKKKYLKAVIIGTAGVSFIRMLPVHYGVHTIICVCLVFILSYTICKIDIMSAGKSSIMEIIMQFIAEGINIAIIEHIFKLDVNVIFNNSYLRVLYGIPSLLICVILIVIYDICKNRKKVK
ncbi:hypothetical protein [Clostridium sp.]|uniref:hypothetical protein n=1 Tax=Clostridium sp. TaxID=1506 RepID=UPI002FCC6145